MASCFTMSLCKSALFDVRKVIKAIKAMEETIEQAMERKRREMRQRIAESESERAEKAFEYQRAMVKGVTEGRKKADRMAALENEIARERKKWYSAHDVVRDAYRLDNDRYEP
jgi:hypothetical protein